MAMTIECTSCQAKFAGKPEFAGRRIRCPKCQNVFRVADEKIEPAPFVATVVEASPPAASAPPKNKYAGKEIDEWNVPADFEYSVAETADPNANRCVFCHAEMRPGDVLCLACGYNRTLGQKMSTKTSDEVLAEETREAERHQISFAGLVVSKKALYISGGVAAAVALVLLLVAPVALAAILLVVGSLLLIVGQFGVVYVAFQESTLQGLLVWLMPIYWWVFVFSRWDEAVLPFVIWAIGLGLVLLAAAIGWSSGAEEAEAVTQMMAAKLWAV